MKLQAVSACYILIPLYLNMIKNIIMMFSTSFLNFICKYNHSCYGS